MIMGMGMDNSFSTSDFGLATSLFYLGFSLEALDHTDPSRVLFIFKRDSAIDEAIQAFWGKTLRVEPIAFWHVQKDLKARIHSRE